MGRSKTDLDPAVVADHKLPSARLAEALGLLQDAQAKIQRAADHPLSTAAAIAGGQVMYTPGYLVKQTLARNGWDQRTLAIVCGWSETKVSRMLTDQESMTAAESLVLAEVLPDLSAEQLLSAQNHLQLARACLLYQPKPRTLPRTDSDRYAELRKLVEAWQAKREDALLIGGTEPQSLTDAANDLATWRHR